MFTVIFALARTVGWIAQWNEMIGDPSYKIGRPRQLYTDRSRRQADRQSLRLTPGPRRIPRPKQKKAPSGRHFFVGRLR
jgi:hypothetical protein